MIKMYFAPNWGLTSEKMVSDYIMQTPDSKGKWNNITYTLNPNEADYLVIQDDCSSDLINKFDKDKRLYFSREAMTPYTVHSYPSSQVNRNSFWDGTNILWTKWWYPNKSSGGIGMTYDEIKLEKSINKTKKLSCIQSDKRMTQGHILRHNFLRRFIERSSENLDLYGSISFANKILDNNEKKYGLDEYEYNLAFDNQSSIPDFFGTQFTDAILRWCVPIYWGGANLQKYFPEGSYKLIDITNDNDYVISEVLDFIQSNSYKSSIGALEEARDLIINKYNMWPILEEAIKI
jgi:hypothetical protein